MLRANLSRERRILLRRGLLGWLAAAAIGILAAWLPPAERLEQTTLDLRYRRFNRDTRASDAIVIVDADEASLKHLESVYGRWPWPRRVYRQLLEYLAAGEPRFVLFDIVFPGASPDRTDDTELGGISGTMGNVSHAALLLEDRVGEGTGSAPLPPGVAAKHRLDARITGWRDPQRAYRDHVLPTAEILSAAKHLHIASFRPDADGIARKLPLLFPYASGEEIVWLPSLALSGLLATLPASRIDLEPGTLVIRSRDTAVQRIPVGDGAELALHHYRIEREPAVIPIAPILASAAAIQRGEGEDPSTLPVSPFEFKGKIVIVGASAVGAHDLKPTPIRAVSPGSLLQATALSNLLLRDYQRPIPAGARAALAALIFALCYLGALFPKRIAIKIALPLGILAAYAALACLSFRVWGTILPMGIPLVVGLATLFDAVAYTGFRENARRKQLQSMLDKYVSPAVRDQLMASGTDPRAEVGATHEVSVLFTDIRGFTHLCEKLEPRIVVERLNEHLGAMTALVFETEGTLDKFIGDAVMAFWGAPLKADDHAMRAVRCGLRMIEAAERVALSWRPYLAEGEHFRIGVGVHSGRAIVGNIGSRQRLDYTVVGDTVNIASRVEGVTKEYGTPVLIGKPTYEAVKSQIVCRFVDSVHVKGRDASIDLYQALEVRREGIPSARARLAEAFGEAHRDFVEGDLSRALARFNAAEREVPEGDRLCQIYAERCRRGLPQATRATG